MGSPIRLTYKDKYYLLEKEKQELLEEINLLKTQLGSIDEKSFDAVKVFNGTVLPVKIYGIEGGLVGANKAVELIFGIPLKDLIGKYNILQDSKEENRESRQSFQRCVAEKRVVTASPLPGQANYENFPGKLTEDFRQMPVWIEKTYFPVIGKNNQVELVGEILMDITNRHHQEQERVSYDEACRILVESSPHGLAIVQKNSDTGRTQVVCANKAAARNLGCTLGIL
jgi:PAS domain-containing protein